MPTLTHKITGQITHTDAQTVKKLREQGKIDAYTVEEDTPPEIPKEIKKMSADKTAESVKHGTSTTIDGTSD